MTHPDRDAYIRAIHQHAPAVDAGRIRHHLDRFDSRYTDVFSTQDIALHVHSCMGLSPGKPFDASIDVHADKAIDCTVFSFDVPGIFSLVSGVLTAVGFNIQSGDIFTSEKAHATDVKTMRRRRALRRPVGGNTFPKRIIIDRFSGFLESSQSLAVWEADFHRLLSEVMHHYLDTSGESREKARSIINERVVERIGAAGSDTRSMLFPVTIEVDTSPAGHTRLIVFSEDTPAFLYAVSNALYLQGISIEHVTIDTEKGRVRDSIDVVDAHGKKIDDPAVMNNLKLAIMLTKQFTLFLPTAPDPFAALHRFEQIVGDLLARSEKQAWIQDLSDPWVLRDLARLLGVSDFLWEDFIRTQYETILPMLQQSRRHRHFSQTLESLPRRLSEALENGNSYNEKIACLNEFKDKEIYQIDLDHILSDSTDFQTLSHRLTTLAEHIVREAFSLSFTQLSSEYGVPRAAASIAADYAVFGLGKFGGAALGYASDIELLTVYSDAGQTDGNTPVTNAEFFEKLVAMAVAAIQAKREGIFTIDLRLRPYGKDGPKACSLESFLHYYGKDGPAHSYERLALVRLRFVAGNHTFGTRIERMRDDTVYVSRSIHPREIRELRKKQYHEKIRGDQRNAKFSPGALVDLEYDVQLLQVIHGEQHPRLRTPRIHIALQELAAAGVVKPDESKRLQEAYDFFRRLVNGLRMLRGTARDLYLPSSDSPEFMHLARRMGYHHHEGLSPAQHLALAFSTSTAVIRVFVEEHFGRDTLPDAETGNIADLLLSANPSPELCRRVLQTANFTLADRAYSNFHRIALRAATMEEFVPLALLAIDILREQTDPDMALNNWERFIRGLPDVRKHFRMLLRHPRRLEILLNIFSGSQFLADTLIRNPEFAAWVIRPEVVTGNRRCDEVLAELDDATSFIIDAPSRLDAVRKFKQREMLRIGVRDFCCNASLKDVTADLSVVAEAFIRFLFNRIIGEEHRSACGTGCFADLASTISVCALGKLGGNELNYSSDIDLVAIIHDEEHAGEDDLQVVASKVMERLRAALADHTREGYVYRVDLRLRPYGSAGPIASPLSSFLHYYREQASLWEIQALLKLRPVAGNEAVGRRLLDHLPAIITQRSETGAVRDSIRSQREKTLRKLARRSHPSAGVNIKDGAGGLRDIEFLVQGLQLLHLKNNPGLFTGNTLDALEELTRCGIMTPGFSAELKKDYLFLRKTEHCLQILNDRQVHELPGDTALLSSLARRVSGRWTSVEEFHDRLHECMTRVHEGFQAFADEKNG